MTNVPELSISTTTTPTREGANATADFTITADRRPVQNLLIQYLPESTFFLPFGITGNAQVTATPLAFTQDPNNSNLYISTLSVPLDDDRLGEVNGTVTVTLQDDSSAESTYAVHATNNVCDKKY